VKKIFRKNQYREGISWLKVGDIHLLEIQCWQPW
jgi:hypothetical protein